MSEQGVTLESRYDDLESDRLVFLDRARRASELTIPTLIPPQAHSVSTIYYTPWQGIGARGVNNLASKLLLSLLPPNSSFFRMTVDEFEIDKLAGQPGGKAIVDEGLAKIERAVMTEVESGPTRSQVFLALKHLIVGGNVLLVLPTDGMRLYRMDSYVVKRDVNGNVLDCIAKDQLAPNALSKKELALLEESKEVEALEKKQGDNGVTEDDPDSSDRTINVYTRWYRTDPDDGPVKWKGYQELNGKRVPGSDGTWPIDKPPFIALRWTTVEGEDYGRGYVEEYLGDLISLEGLSKSIVQGSAAAARLVFLLNPNGVTKLDSFRSAENGDVISGKADDVTVAQSQKQQDLGVAHQAAQSILERLSFAFLLNSSIQRNAERVTAEEVRYMAGELEAALGGVYSILAQEFQLPFVVRIIDRMTKAKKLPPLPNGVVKPVIVTGLEALGRGHDLQKYTTFLQILQPLGPEVIAQFLNVADFISRVGTSLDIDPEGLVKSQAQMQQEQQQQQQQQMVNTGHDAVKAAAPAVVKAMSDQAMQQKQLAADNNNNSNQGNQ